MNGVITKISNTNMLLKKKYPRNFTQAPNVITPTRYSANGGSSQISEQQFDS